jgi:hypothetical protein
LKIPFLTLKNAIFESKTPISYQKTLQKTHFPIKNGTKLDPVVARRPHPPRFLGVIAAKFTYKIMGNEGKNDEIGHFYI